MMAAEKEGRNWVGQRLQGPSPPKMENFTNQETRLPFKREKGEGTSPEGCVDLRCHYARKAGFHQNVWKAALQEA